MWICQHTSVTVYLAHGQLAHQGEDTHERHAPPPLPPPPEAANEGKINCYTVTIYKKYFANFLS